jgi:GNAT superfamily N-acetyltransferase
MSPILHLNPLSKSPPNAQGESDVYLLPHLATLQLRAWLLTRFFPLMYPGPPSTHPVIIEGSAAWHRKGLLEDPNCHFVSLVGCREPEVGEEWRVVAFIKWDFVPRLEDEEMGVGEKEAKRTWPPGMHVACIEWFWGRLLEVRAKMRRELGEHVFVNILGTDPDWQRLGAGKMLMDVVCAEADRRNVRAWVEASEEGRRLYEKCGFAEVGGLWCDLGRWVEGGDKGEGWRGEGWKEGVGEGWYWMSFMVRPARGQEGNGVAVLG